MEKEKVQTYLREWARKRGLTSKKLAEKLNITPEGARQQLKNPTLFNLQTLCDILGIESYQAFIDPLDKEKTALTRAVAPIPESEKTEIKMIRASRLDIEKAVNVLEKSLAFQNAEVSRMKTKVKIMERAVIEQRKIAERLKKAYLSD